MTRNGCYCYNLDGILLDSKRLSYFNSSFTTFGVQSTTIFRVLHFNHLFTEIITLFNRQPSSEKLITIEKNPEILLSEILLNDN